MTLLSTLGGARGYCNDYEDEDELKLNSAQHARSAASRLDDVIDRSALEQAREGLGGRDIEEPLIWTWSLESKKSTLEDETAVRHHAIRKPPFGHPSDSEMARGTPVRNFILDFGRDEAPRCPKHNL